MKKYINQQDMKESNAADVFALVKKKQRITRKQIAEKLGMSWGAVSTITAQLVEEGYLVEKKADSDGCAGRIPSYLEVNGNVHFSLGIDVNNVGFRAVLINLKGDILSFWEGEGDVSASEVFIPSLLAFIHRIVADVGRLNIIGIGIAMQGVVNAKTGISVSIPGRSDWSDLPLSDIVSGEFGIPVFIEHDPTCILYAASREDPKTDYILIRTDDGIGMAAMIGGKIIDKPGIFEIGHTVAVPGGIPCKCGKRGCLGKYASCSGLTKQYGKSFEAIISDAEDGNAEASRLLGDAARHLAFAINNASLLLNIDNVILCGSFWNNKDLFWREFESRVSELHGGDGIKFSFTGVSSAPIGAAHIAMNAVLKKIAI